MSEACQTCAFKDGCAANLEPYNRVRSEVCALSAIPFYCHTTFDWRNTDLSTMTRDEVAAFRKGMTVCQGWRRRVAELAKHGHFKVPGVREVRRILGQNAILIIQRVVKTEDRAEKDQLYRSLDEYVRMLIS